MNEHIERPVAALVIDDEVQIRRLIRLTLEAHGYRVFEAGTGQEGLLEAAQRRPEIVLLDLGLPDLDGVTVLKRLREWSHVPVVVLSVRDREADKIAALDNGADDSGIVWSADYFFPSPLTHKSATSGAPMSQRTESRLPKLPFVFADIVLLGVAYLIFWRSPAPMTPWDMFFCAASVSLGAVLCVAPFLLEYRAAMKLAEADRLANAVLQIENIEIIGRQINHATANWQAAQEQANKCVEAARAIAESITAEARSFSEFLKKANETEKNHLRLEVDKLRRAESEWLQILVRILDHIFALNQAAVHSGQTSLVKQLGQFQNACRDIARRVGLVPFVAIPGEPYDPKVHQLADAKVVPAAAARVAETVATGYSFQGQLVRPALVTLQTSPAADQPEDTANRPGAEAVASEKQSHGAELETEFAAVPAEEIPQLAQETVEPSPQIAAKEPLDSGQEELRR